MMLRRPRRLFTRLVVPFIVLLGFLSVVGTFVIVRQTFGTVRERQYARSAEAATRARVALAGAEERAVAAVTRLATDPRLGPAPANAGDEFALLSDAAAQAHLTAVFDTSGDRAVVVAAATPSGPLPPSELARLSAAIADADPVRAVAVRRRDATGDKWAGIVRPASGDTLLLVTAPLAGDVHRAVLAAVDIDAVLAPQTRLAGVDLGVLAPDGSVLSSTFPYRGTGAFGLPAATLAAVNRGEQAGARTRWVDGTYTVAVAPLRVRGTTAGFIAAAAADAPVMLTLGATRGQVVAVLAGGLFAVALIGLVLSRRISRSVTALVAAADRVAEGDFEARVDVRSDDELGRLGDAFNAMAARLGTYDAEQSTVIAGLRDLDRAKDELIANVSHELRTPLTPIKGAAAALARHELDPHRRIQLAELIAANSDRLLAQLNRMIAATSNAAGRGPSPTAAVDVAAAVGGALAQLPSNQRDRVHLRAAAGTPCATGDPAGIAQIAFELLDNAAKFSDGAIDVDVCVEAGRVCLRVRDHGGGIADADLPEVFGRFHQLDASSTRRHGGLGLGLAVARDLAVWMRADLGLEAADGGGLVATLTLPAAATGASGPDATTPAREEPAAVLRR